MAYDFKFSASAWKRNNTRLTNQIFKLLPMYENGENWEKQQRTIMLELRGYNDIFSNDVRFMILVAKLGALSHVADRMEFRKLVFEALTELKNIELDADELAE